MRWSIKNYSDAGKIKAILKHTHFLGILFIVLSIFLNNLIGDKIYKYIVDIGIYLTILPIILVIFLRSSRLVKVLLIMATLTFLLARLLSHYDLPLVVIVTLYTISSVCIGTAPCIFFAQLIKIKEDVEEQKITETETSKGCLFFIISITVILCLIYFAILYYFTPDKF